MGINRIEHSNADFPRLSELRDLSISLRSSSSFFVEGDDKFTHPYKQRFFLDIEQDLQALDDDAWLAMKASAMPLLDARNERRGWQPLFDLFNEAKGFAYLRHIGCERIRFIPRIRGAKTPDLEANLASTKVLCEVKTINKSDEEIDRFSSGGIGGVSPFLAEGLLKKIASHIEQAMMQLKAFDAGGCARKIVYVVVNFDERFECQDGYKMQVQAYIPCICFSACELVFRWPVGNEQTIDRRPAAAFN